MSTELSVFNEMGGVSVNASSALDTLERASIDIQVSTAHHYPRSMTTFKDRAIAIACGDEETGASCLYNRPVGKPGSGKQIFAQGMSVRMAEIVASCYGNLRVGARIIEQTERQVVAQGIAHDLETNFLCTSEVIESTVDKNGEPFTERMRITVAKAALAKARRDAIFQVVPKALAKPVEEAVRRMLYGNQASLTARRERVNLWVTTLGIDKQRVWNAVGVNGADDLTPATMSTQIGRAHV